MSLDWDSLKDQMYECVRCKSIVKGTELLTFGRIQCPYCRFKVIRKIRPPIVKRIKVK